MASLCWKCVLGVCLVLLFSDQLFAQESGAGAVRGTVSDPTGARIAAASVTARSNTTGIVRQALTGPDGDFALQFLQPGEYTLRVEAAGMSAEERGGIRVEVGGTVTVAIALRLAGRTEAVTVASESGQVETQPSGVSAVLDERSIHELPLNGRRFTDLALLTPGVTADPRGMNSTSVGDLSFGGVRGYASTFLVDGVDGNNSFYAQMRGRYRAPYQFSNETVQEFRVSSNTYGAELGRSGGAVINVVTKSGTNNYHGSAFWYLRDGQLGAQPRFVGFKPPNHQNQFGFTVGGPIRKDGLFFYGGFDQHIFHVPTVVHFLNGTTTVTATPDDYEATDQALVESTAAALSTMGGAFPSEMVGNTGFVKFDWSLSPKHFLVLRLNTSRYWGSNNVYLDPASPITYYATSGNGEEEVSTESASLALTSSLSLRVTSNLRLLFARDLQQSSANSSDVQTRIYDIIDGFGRSIILPRNTREHRLHVVETVAVDGRRHAWKFGADFNQAWVENYFPLMSGGTYIFDNTRVNPFTFKPMTYGMRITPLRAYAHGVPRYYYQDFGETVTHPDTREYAFFAQDTIRVTSHLALSLGVRYDLQTFRSEGLISNPAWPGSGQLPTDTNNIAPRFGFAYSIGDANPLVIRGGFGWFFTRVPQIYNSSIEIDNGLNRQHVFLKNTQGAPYFPTYPEPAASCPPGATTCDAPATVAGMLSSDISAFSSNFTTPVVRQGSFTIEKEIWRRFAIGAAYLYVNGRNLIRARDVNLPEPQTVYYPVYDADDVYTGQELAVESFATWQMKPSLTCPWPPCVNDLTRPNPNVGAIDVFESAASSVYHGLTISAKRRMTSGLYFRLAYTFAKATDDVQDALLIGSSSVQNTFQPSEWARSVTDQRHRVAISWSWEPKFFHRDQLTLKKLFNDWNISGVVTVGSGRPYNARVVGDANGDDNTDNDRLPGYSRNAFTGPDYATTDLRLSRTFYLGSRLKLIVLVESFNVFNRSNERVDVSDQGFMNTAATFIPVDRVAGAAPYPAYYQQSAGFTQPTNAYAPRQVQFGIRLRF